MRIYMDVCCWNRPFDEQGQPRIHLEAEAVLYILKLIEQGTISLLHSEMVDLEMDDNPDSERQQRLRNMIPRRHRFVRHDRRIEHRAVELEEFGFVGIDALHIAAAEAGGADVLLTTDDRMLRKAARHSDALGVIVANPLAFVQDMSGDNP